MASNLAGAACIGQHSVCVIRAALLDPDCSHQAGADAAWTSLGLITLTDSPEYDDDFNLEPLNGCGTKLYTVSEPGKIIRHNLTGDLGYHDWEMMALLFGGTTVLGKAGGPYAGKVIGWASRSPTDTTTQKSVYLEVITKNISATAGECTAASGASGYPPYQGHIYGGSSCAAPTARSNVTRQSSASPVSPPPTRTSAPAHGGTGLALPRWSTRSIRLRGTAKPSSTPSQQRRAAATAPTSPNLRPCEPDAARRRALGSAVQRSRAT